MFPPALREMLGTALVPCPTRVRRDLCSTKYVPLYTYGVRARSPLLPLVQAAVKKWCDDSSVDLVLTSGGTGFGRRDLTPEAIRPLLHRSAVASWCRFDGCGRAETVVARATIYRGRYALSFYERCSPTLIFLALCSSPS